MKSGNTGNRRRVPKSEQERKSLIPDRYIRLTGYNRKYAGHILSKPVPDKTVTTVIDGEPLLSKRAKSRREAPVNRGAMGLKVFYRTKNEIAPITGRFYAV
jgi:hypothetical protein